MKNENESSLQTVHNGGDVSERNGLFVDKRQTERPRQTE